MTKQHVFLFLAGVGVVFGGYVLLLQKKNVTPNASPSTQIPSPISTQATPPATQMDSPSYKLEGTTDAKVPNASPNGINGMSDKDDTTAIQKDLDDTAINADFSTLVE